MSSSPPAIGTTYQSVLGAVITHQRTSGERTITQTEIAAALDITVSTWSRIERGESSLSLEQLVRLVAFLGMSLSELFKVVEERVGQLAAQGISVAVSKEALEKDGVLQLTTTQLISIALPMAGPLGLAAWGIYKALRGLKKN
jgi:transcriptional regulator with XRE-family HTH domain